MLFVYDKKWNVGYKKSFGPSGLEKYCRCCYEKKVVTSMSFP